MHAPNAMPKEWSWRGYIEVFNSIDLVRIFLNTIFVATSITFLNCLLSSMVAFAIVKDQYARS